jgi:hypothetical protein
VTDPTCDVAGCVARYAARLHAAIGDSHQVASPLGAWLLLALAAPASTGADRAALTEIIGCDADAAAAAAARLLAAPHPEVASTAAVWTAPRAPLADEFRQWQSGLPPEVATGDLPDQAGLDAWAREATLGLIESFPLQWAPDLYLVLATALATRVSWQVPFDLAPAADLGSASPWSRQLTQVLRTPRGSRTGHSQFIAATAGAGDVAVHVAAARRGLLVCSVAADPAVPSGPVLAAAHEIGCAHAIAAPVRQRALADLPLGDGPAWEVRAEPGAGLDECTAVLPAWEARSRHDLSEPGLGFAAAKHALAPGPDPWQAAQAAMARYSRTGFEAAAVTAVAAFMAALAPRRDRRVAELRFGHPYAVVAVALGADGPGPPDQADYRAWHGVPVFSAWVAEPQDAGDGPA